MIIAIDGPAASGKGTLGRLIAAHYGLPHLDTGKLYRAVARAFAKRDELRLSTLTLEGELVAFDLCIVANGPASAHVRSSTRTPSSGAVIPDRTRDPPVRRHVRVGLPAHRPSDSGIR